MKRRVIREEILFLSYTVNTMWGVITLYDLVDVYHWKYLNISWRVFIISLIITLLIKTINWIIRNK